MSAVSCHVHVALLHMHLCELDLVEAAKDPSELGACVPPGHHQLGLRGVDMDWRGNLPSGGGERTRWNIWGLACTAV